MLNVVSETKKFSSLLGALVVRHLAQRYRGSFFGFAWSLLNPLCLMLVYALVFKYYIRFDQVNNYTIFLFTGLLPWIWFTSGLTEGTCSIANGGSLITKSMFPAHILTTVSTLTTGVNFLLSLPLLFLFMIVMGQPFHMTILLLPVLIVLQGLFIWGISLALAAINVHLRDVQHILGNLLTLIFFLCPVIYPASSVPEKFRWTLEVNPCALFITIYHQIILEGVMPSTQQMLLLCLYILLSLTIGVVFYSKKSESFAELL